MQELMVVLDFGCASCTTEMHVTVKCSGNGLDAAPDVAAAFQVRCPACDEINQVVFAPNGEVLRVAAFTGCCRRWEPSLN